MSLSGENGDQVATMASFEGAHYAAAPQHFGDMGAILHAFDAMVAKVGGAGELSSEENAESEGVDEKTREYITEQIRLCKSNIEAALANSAPSMSMSDVKLTARPSKTYSSAASTASTMSD